MTWISDVVRFLDTPACMLIVGEDGVRAFVGTTGTSTLIDLEQDRPNVGQPSRP